MSAGLRLRGRIATPTGLVPGQLVVEGERIVAVEPEPGGDAGEAATTPIIAPGFIDLQVNGGFGVDAAAGAAAIAHLARELPRTGVTSFLPTMISGPEAALPTACADFLGARARFEGAAPLGLHLEGPWLSPQRPGVHPPQAIAAASWARFREAVTSGAVALVTLAPERDGALEAIAFARDHGVVVSLGHTDASYETMAAGIAAGARMATHLWNAMSGLHHRAPGAVGAVLDDARIVAGLVADGLHVHPAAVRIATRCKGPRGLAIVSDAISAMGCEPGRYRLGSVEIMADGRAARLADGTLAGSLLTMDQAVRNLVAWGAADLGDALAMASTVPAALLGWHDRGRIEPGLRADVVVLDASLHVQTTIIRGRVQGA